MKVKIKYWVNGYDTFKHELEIKEGMTAWVELPRDATPELREHHITIEREEA